MPHQGFRFPVEKRHVLNEEERRRSLAPVRLLREAGIKPGETAVDVGAGTGFWTVPLSELVGARGRVIAVDVEPVMLDELRALIQNKHLDNVDVVQSAELKIPVEGGIADAVILGFVLHEPDDIKAFLGEVRRILKPGGRVLLADWHKRQTENGPPLAHRLSEDESKEWLATLGLEVAELAVANADVYALVGCPASP